MFEDSDSDSEGATSPSAATKDDATSFHNIEFATAQKRLWQHTRSLSTDVPDFASLSLFEHFVVVGLPPEADVAALAASAKVRQIYRF